MEEREHTKDERGYKKEKQTVTDNRDFYGNRLKKTSPFKKTDYSLSRFRKIGIFRSTFLFKLYAKFEPGGMEIYIRYEGIAAAPTNHNKR